MSESPKCSSHLQQLFAATILLQKHVWTPGLSRKANNKKNNNLMETIGVGRWIPQWVKRAKSLFESFLAMGYASSPLASILKSLHEAHRNFENIPTCPSINTWNNIPHQGVGGALIDLCVALLRMQVFQKIWIPIKIWVKSDRYRDWKLFGRHISY